MKIKIIGAGPAGLYFAALMKQHDPGHQITLYERNPRHATWGFGVVFSDRALEFLRADDEALYQYLTSHLESWPDITVVHNDTRIPIAGNGFASIGRLELLSLLYAYVEKLGVEIQFETEITSLEQVNDADLVVALEIAHFRGCAVKMKKNLEPTLIGVPIDSYGTERPKHSTASL